MYEKRRRASWVEQNARNAMNEAVLVEAQSEGERATGGPLTVDDVLSGDAPQGLSMARWVEGVLARKKGLGL